MTSPATQHNAPALPSLILLSHQSLPSPSAPSAAPTFQHPEIVYHFLDDPPLALIPPSPHLPLHPAASFISTSPAAGLGVQGAGGEEKEVLVMDWDPAAVARGEQPVVRSLTAGLAVKGVRVDWEGVPAGQGGKEGMVVIETIGLGGNERSDRDAAADPLLALARFAQRNALIRETLDYRPPPAQLAGGDEDPPSPEKERDAVSVSPTSTV